MGSGSIGRGAALVAAITLGTVTLLAGTGPDVAAGRPKPTTPPAASGTIYAYQRAVPVGTWAVAPDGSRVAACAGDRQHRATDRRLVTVEDVAGESYPVVWPSAVVQVARQRLVTRNEACADPLVAWDVPAGLRVDYPTWSQDGTRVAVRAIQYDTAGVATAQGIWVGDFDGTCGPGLCGVHLAVPFPMVVGGTGPGGEPVYRSLTATARWSMDGHTVVYGRAPADGSSGGELYLADVGAPGSATVGAEVRIPVEGDGVSPVFSPVDDRIAFVHPNRTSACRLNDLLITSRTGEIQPVITGNMLSACAIGGIDWSPDGASIAFNAGAKSAGQDDIWTIRVGASKATLVLSTPGAWYWVTGWR